MIFFFYYCFFCVVVAMTLAVLPQANAQTYPNLFPDYVEVTLPPNIAPLNFIIQEEAESYRVHVESSNGDPITLENQHGSMQFPLQAWKRLLQSNRGNDLVYTVSIQNNGQWQMFDPFSNHIAEFEIDSHVVYRLLNSAYTRWSEMGIYQRHVETFEEEPIIHNRATEGKCMNCHSFHQHNPETLMMHLRGGESSGTLIAQDGQVIKVNTATEFNRAGAYPAWHSNGELIAFSVNKLEMFFHSQGQDPRDVLDRGSDLILYDIPNNTVTTVPRIASPERMETFPAWSPDGRYLYFCSCPDFGTFIDGDEFRYQDILYDLYRIAYDPESGDWGEVELMLSGNDVGKSITFPRASPDGQALMFCMANDGHFPIYKPSTDLYLLDLQTMDYEKLPINSDQADTYHTWSSDGRWVVFSSKRIDGVTARPYFAYRAPDGTFHKPFVLPQKDPVFYRSFLKTYNRPELITGPVTLRPQHLVDTAYDNEHRRDATLDEQVQVREQPVGGEQMYNLAPN